MFESPYWFQSHPVESLGILPVLGQQEFQNVLHSVPAPAEITAANITDG